MHGGELVEQLRVDQLQTRLEQFSADQQRQNATKNQHGESKQQVQGTDVFVVGSEHPTTPTLRGVMVIMIVMASHVAVRIDNCAHGITSSVPDYLAVLAWATC
jgi:hypothetical protein